MISALLVLSLAFVEEQLPVDQLNRGGVFITAERPPRQEKPRRLVELWNKRGSNLRRLFEGYGIARIFLRSGSREANFTAET